MKNKICDHLSKIDIMRLKQNYNIETKKDIKKPWFCICTLEFLEFLEFLELGEFTNHLENENHKIDINRINDQTICFKCNLKFKDWIENNSRMKNLKSFRDIKGNYHELSYLFFQKKLPFDLLKKSDLKTPLKFSNSNFQNKMKDDQTQFALIKNLKMKGGCLEGKNDQIDKSKNKLIKSGLTLENMNIIKNKRKIIETVFNNLPIKKKKELSIKINNTNMRKSLKKFEFKQSHTSLSTRSSSIINHKNLGLKRKNPIQNLSKMNKGIYFNTIRSQNDFDDKVFGLQNLGNTCFFNSVLQILLNSNNFLTFLKKNEKNIKKNGISENLIDLKKESNSIKNPMNIFLKLINKDKMYRNYLQQDSHECLVKILDLIEEDLIDKRAIEEIVFNGYLIFNIRCLNCNTSEFIFEKNSGFIIRFDIENAPNDSIKQNLQKKLKDFSQRISPALYYPLNNSEIVDNINVQNSEIDLNNEKLFININSRKPIKGCDVEKKLFQQYFDFFLFSKLKNNYECEKCKENSTSGFKKYYILKPPKNLIICLNKFYQINSELKIKNNKISFNLTLDLSNHIIVKKENILTEKDFIYNLYGLIQHKGNLNGGHYSCYVKKQDGWYYISDTFFEKVSVEVVLSSVPYLLFYTN